MLKLNPVYKDYIWGGDKLNLLFGLSEEKRLAESWELSVHPDGVSTYEASFADYIKNNPQAVDGAGFNVFFCHGSYLNMISFPNSSSSTASASVS